MPLGAIKRQSWLMSGLETPLMRQFGLIRGHQEALMAHQCRPRVPRADPGKVGVALLRRQSVEEFKQVGHVRPVLQERRGKKFGVISRNRWQSGVKREMV
jgi:hypothetical protein